MSSPPFRAKSDGQRIVICDYNALLLSVTGLLRMAGYCVFQAHDGYAADELCLQLPDISLLILNTEGTGVAVAQLIQRVRTHVPGLPVLHIGSANLLELPADVPTIEESFTPDHLLAAVAGLIKEQSSLV